MPRRALLLALLLAALPAPADTLHLKNGTVLEGKILSEKSGVYEIRTRFGVQRIEAARVERVERGPSPEEAFEARFEALAAGDKAGAVALWRFAREKKLVKEEARAAERVLRLDPDNEDVHLALKHVRFEGKWVTPAEAERFAKDREIAEARAKGLVEYQGKWVTREEKEAREKGMVLKDGKWVTAEEAKAAEGLVFWKGEWIKKDELEGRKEAAELQEKTGVALVAVDRQSFRVLTDYAADAANAVADAAEKALSTHRTTLQPAEELWPAGQKARVYCFRQQPPFLKFVDQFAAAQKLEKWWAALVKTQTGFYYYSIKPPLIADWRGPRSEADTAFSAAHKVGHIGINLLHERYFTHVPPWLDEGYATWLEDKTLGAIYSYCVSSTYGGPPPRQDKWASSSGWREMLKELASRRADRAIKELLPMEWNELGYQETAKARGVVDYIISKSPAGFVKLVGEMKSRFPRFALWKEMSPRQMAEKQEEAWKAALGVDVAEFERRWREEYLGAGK